MRTLFLNALVGAFGIAGGAWFATPSESHISLSDEQMAQCKALGGCFIVPKAVIQRLSQETDCGRGRT